MPKFIRRGQKKVREEFVQAHCQRLHQWYDAQGGFVYPGQQPDSRERLWACTSLLQQARSRDRQLAEAIIRATPIDDNGFEPVAAIDLLMAYPDRLSPAVRDHLRAMCRSHLASALEHRFAAGGNHNFSCMYSYFLACAGQALDRYQFEVEHHLIPEVYSAERLRQIGFNAMLLVDSYAQRDAVFSEWNSPTYSAVSLMALAKTVRDSRDPRIRRFALEAQLKLWRELLALYHPRLNAPCGPYSRAYRVDILGQVSLLRALFCYVGVSRDRSIVELLDENQPGVHFHHGRNLPFNWANIAWLLGCDYHLPADAWTELRRRQFPKRFAAPIAWDCFGAVDAEKKRYLSVQGQAFAAGAGQVVQVQHSRWALGYRTASTYSHSFPIHLHYAIAARPGPMATVRHVTLGVGLLAQPEEWAPGGQAGPVEADNFNHGFRLAVQENAGGVGFSGAAMNNLAALPTEEVSFNCFIPLHSAAVDQATLNGQVWQDGQRVELKAKQIGCRILDHGCEYEIIYQFDSTIPVVLERWANFLRLAAFFHRGEARVFSPRQLAAFRVRGRLRLLRMPR